MPKLYDRTYGVTENELIDASINNNWTVGDILSAQTRQVKLVRIFEELDDNGYLHKWAINNHCSEQDIYNVLMNNFDNSADFVIYNHVRGIDVRCVLTIENMKFYMFIPTKEDNFLQLESRVRKLEQLLKSRN